MQGTTQGKIQFFDRSKVRCTGQCIEKWSMNLQPMPELLYPNTIWALTTQYYRQDCFGIVQTDQQTGPILQLHTWIPPTAIYNNYRSWEVQPSSLFWANNYVNHHTIIHKKVKKNNHERCQNKVASNTAFIYKAITHQTTSKLPNFEGIGA